MLELVDQGKLGWTVAHEALPFVGTGHVHQEELEYLATALPRSRVLKDGRKIDKVAVLKIMSNAMGHGTNHQKWEHFEENDWVYIGGSIHNDHKKEKPLFDVAAFQERYFDYLHSLPRRHYETERVLWTCRGQQWRGEQDRAKEEAQKKAEENTARVAALNDPIPKHPETDLIQRMRDQVDTEESVGLSHTSEQSEWNYAGLESPCDDEGYYANAFCVVHGAPVEDGSGHCAEFNRIGLHTDSPALESEMAAQLQDMSMAAIPADELIAEPAREVPNCAAGLKVKGDHWHVEWNATRSIWMKQSPAFLDYSEAVKYLENVPADVEPVIVQHIYHPRPVRPRAALRDSV